MYLPAEASVTGKYIRKRFKRKADALAYAGQLNIKLATRTVAPLQNEIHHIAARYQDKLTPAHICKPEELESLLEHGCHHVQAWIMFGAFGGLRSSEIRLMKWEDVRLDENQFFIAGTKNENAERFVKLTAPLKAYCKDMLEGDKPAKGLVFGGLSDAQRQKLMELAYEKSWLPH